MIPASTLYEAVIKNPGKGKPTEVTYPVVAWDDAGHALIADTSAGKLVRASEDPNFGGLRPARTNAAGVIPGGGYRIVFKQQDGPFVMDVLAWTVDADRYAVRCLPPMTAASTRRSTMASLSVCSPRARSTQVTRQPSPAGNDGGTGK